MDLQALTEAEFVALIDEVARERDRRAVLATTQQVVEQATAAYYEAAGGDGREWRQPLGAHDAYPLGAVDRVGPRVGSRGAGRRGRCSHLWRGSLRRGPGAHHTDGMGAAPRACPVGAGLALAEGRLGGDLGAPLLCARAPRAEAPVHVVVGEVSTPCAAVAGQQSSVHKAQTITA